MSASPGRITLLQIVPGMVSGGVERGVIDVARRCSENGGRALVISSGGALVSALEQAGAKHITLPVHSKNPLTMLANVNRIAAVIKSAGVDIVHARSRAPAWSACYACKRTGVPMVTTFHGVYGSASRLKRFYNGIMLKGEKTIVASRYIRSHIVHTYGKEYLPKLALIPRGADINEFAENAVSEDTINALKLKYQITPGQKVILLPGRVSRWKGHDIFIKALARMQQKTGWVALIAGDADKRADYTKALRILAQREGIADRIRWIPDTREINAFYRIADIAVSASTQPEAFGRTVVEAQLSGCPVIAAAHGGALDTVIHAKTGLLIPPRDPDALQEAIAYALFMPEQEREHMTEAAKKRAEKYFSLHRMLDKTFTLYGNVLRER